MPRPRPWDSSARFARFLALFRVSRELLTRGSPRLSPSMPRKGSPRFWRFLVAFWRSWRPRYCARGFRVRKSGLNMGGKLRSRCWGSLRKVWSGSPTREAEVGSCWRPPLLPLVFAPPDELAAEELPVDLPLRLRWFGGLRWCECEGVGVGGLGAGVLEDEFIEGLEVE